MAGVPLERIAVFSPLERSCRSVFGDFGIGLQVEIEIHQARAQAWAVEFQRRQGEVECVAGDLPEVGVSAGEPAQPGVLQLLLAPEFGQALPVVAKFVAGAARRAVEIEKRSVGVENAGCDAVEGLIVHAR